MTTHSKRSPRYGTDSWRTDYPIDEDYAARADTEFRKEINEAKRNEAAERLLDGVMAARAMATLGQQNTMDLETLERLLDEALAAERRVTEAETRRATVERIRTAIDNLPGHYVQEDDLGWMVRRDSVANELDAEAQR